MKLLTLMMATFVFLSGCRVADEVGTAAKNTSTERVWVFAQFNVPEENDGLESYYYYGNVAKPLFDAISDNQIEDGFIILKKVRYWGDDDRVHEYQDSQDSGDLVFRIADIRRIKQIKQDPLLDPANKQEVIEFQQ
ncbi:hypothetical protein [Motilimonas eburnea]|uniref:hypothetical protein n=1 Tax=Motilimonas eburnea TaxID=1737488 RepID=UPI001E2D4C6D|nr:hypothetical protein [Motilimonas eburnea]MCE2570963.1 hypothetical protein [Motilimonas eburnea]